MKKKTPSKVLVARKKLALELAEEAMTYIADKHGRDVDLLARVLEAQIPLSNAEAQAEFDFLEDDDKPQRRSPVSDILGRLQAALGIPGARLPMMSILTGCAERLESLKPTGNVSS